MHRNIIVLFLLLLFSGVSSLLFYALGDAKSFHLAQEICNSCHLTRGNVKSGNAHQLITSQELLCKTCHPNALMISHPTGFAPNRTMPPGYPLDWKGELTCSSCHEVHGTAPGLMRTELRGRDFCFSCHEKPFFDKMADLGTNLLSSGHLVTKPSANAFPDTIDIYSLKCLECHSNQTDQLFVSLSAQGIVTHAGQRISHPIGRDYKQAALFGGYRDVENIPNHILLPDGKVSCISCHQGYSAQHGKLVEPKSSSALCFHCHDL